MEVIVYGTGKYSEKFIEQCSLHYNVRFFVDSNPEKQGKLFHGCEIKKPDALKNYIDTLIIIAIRAWREAEIDLWEMGCNNIRYFSPDKGVVSIDKKAELRYFDQPKIYWSISHDKLCFDAPYSCTSQICNQSFFDAPFFQYWSSKFMANFFDHISENPSISMSNNIADDNVIYHRKLWEWVYIAQALYERGLLNEGKKGLAFGVGKECTPDLFASYGCEILATDLVDNEAVSQGWIKSGQNAGGNLQLLNKYKFCNKKEFYERVTYRNVDMNNIPSDIKGYDFCWSACALEHLGSIQNGLDFIKNSLDTIVDGGIAVHTTEYNLGSNDDTIETKSLCVYRRSDIEKLIEILRSEGHYVYPVDWHLGEGVVDKFVDLPPYGRKDMHLRLRIEDYPCTSIGLIIKK